MRNNIKELRVSLHMLMLYIMSHPAWRDSPDMVMAKLSLTSARHWFGKLLGQIGDPNPYPNSTSMNTIIEPSTDTYTGELAWPSDNPIEQVKWLRSQIDDALTKTRGIHGEHIAQAQGGAVGDLKVMSCFNAYSKLTEAKMWLGEELGANYVAPPKEETKEPEPQPIAYAEGIKAIAVAFTLKGQPFSFILPHLEQIAQHNPGAVLIHGFMPKEEVLKRNLSPEVAEAIDRLFPNQHRFYVAGTGEGTGEVARVAMAQTVRDTGAEVFVIGNIVEGVAQEVELYRSIAPDARITYVGALDMPIEHGSDKAGSGSSSEGSAGAHHDTNGSMGIDNETADRGNTPVNENDLRPAPEVPESREETGEGGPYPEPEVPATHSDSNN